MGFKSQPWPHEIEGRKTNIFSVTEEKQLQDKGCSSQTAFFLLLSKGQSHLFTETFQSFNKNQKGSRGECKDHLFYQMPELP